MLYISNIIINNLIKQMVLIMCALCFLCITFTLSSCRRTEKTVIPNDDNSCIPAVCSLVEIYKTDYVLTYGKYAASLDTDSAFFNIEIRIEDQDTLFSIHGSPWEEYDCMYDNFCQTREEQVYAFNSGKETIVLYFLERIDITFIQKIIGPYKLNNVRDYVLNYFPEGEERYMDGDYFTYKYKTDGSFRLLRKHY